MKKNLLSLGFTGLVTLFFGCSGDTGTNPAIPPVAEVSSSSIAPAPASSSSVQTPTPGLSSSSAKTDTVRTIITVPSDTKIDYPYKAPSDVFCFTPKCEETVKPATSSSKAVVSSSSNGGGITIDAPENKPPVVNGSTMTDTRDNKTYQLLEISGKLWMAQDLNYEGASGECYNDVAENCTTNGRLYTFNAAQKACPTGWRLPTREEAQAALNNEAMPWSYSGRCKDGDCNFLGDMGFHWTSGTPESGDKKFDENGGANGALIIVEKSPEYVKDKEGEDRLFFQVDQKAKRFSIRCVQE